MARAISIVPLLTSAAGPIHCRTPGCASSTPAEAGCLLGEGGLEFGDDPALPFGQPDFIWIGDARHADTPPAARPISFLAGGIPVGPITV